MRQYEMFELTFRGPELKEQWAAVGLPCVFTHESGKKIQVMGFYAGNGEYKIRFLPDKSGWWEYFVTGVINAGGNVQCEPAVSSGPVRAKGTGFYRADGSCFHPFGTTVYALMHQDTALIDRTMESLKKAPFNKVRLCVFPKHYKYNANEPDFYAFERSPDGSWDVSRPSFAFWEHFEQRLNQLYRMRIEADIILFHPYDRWGFSQLTQEENLLYLDYLIRRLAAFPNVWWSLANEYDVCLARKSQQNWEEIEEFVASHDPYGHPLSNHNIANFWDAARPNITHASLQTKRIAEIPRFLKRYGKPVVIDECCYEGDIMEPWGAISGREMTYRFWRTVCSGGYCTHGETFYDEQDVLWWAKGGVLKGESPARIAFLRGIVEALPHHLEPVSGQFEAMISSTAAELETVIPNSDENTKGLLTSLLRMDPEERLLFSIMERTYSVRCGNDVFLMFYDQRTSAKDILPLPEDGRYTIEVIDVWEMTRKTLMTGVSGPTEVSLPGKEGIAVLAAKEEKQ